MQRAEACACVCHHCDIFHFPFTSDFDIRHHLATLLVHLVCENYKKTSNVHDIIMTIGLIYSCTRRHILNGMEQKFTVNENICHQLIIESPLLPANMFLRNYCIASFHLFVTCCFKCRSVVISAVFECVAWQCSSMCATKFNFPVRLTRRILNRTTFLARSLFKINQDPPFQSARGQGHRQSLFRRGTGRVNCACF